MCELDGISNDSLITYYILSKFCDSSCANSLFRNILSYNFGTYNFQIVVTIL